MSKSLTLIKNNNNENSNASRQQIIKKNKIINIRIYQNYSSDKNSNTFFNPCSNNIINNINIPLKVINELGTQTITEKEDKKIMKKKNSIKKDNNFQRYSVNDKKNKEVQKNEIKYNFNKTFSANFKKQKILNKNDNKVVRKKKNNMTKNHSYNLTKKTRQIINLKVNIPNKKNKSKIFEVNEDLNNSIINKTNKIKRETNYNNKNNEINNKSDEKNKIAKKYSLFNLKNDNKYLIINDGNYDSHYHENSKISINNIYAKKEKKDDYVKNNFIMKSPNTQNEIKFENYLHSERNLYSINDFFSKNIKNKSVGDKIVIKKDEINNIINKNMNNLEKTNVKENKKFEKLSIIKNNDIFINEGKKYSDINDIEINKGKNKINDTKEYYSQFIKNIHDNVNKFFFNFGNNPNNNAINLIKEKYINNNISNQKLIINDITKNSFQIISKNIQKENKECAQLNLVNKENKKINKDYESFKKIKNKKNVLIIERVNKEKAKKKENIMRQNIIKLKENKNPNKKYESFLYDMTQEDENGIKFEDLLKTYTEESIKDNQSIDEINNKIIGDEKTFFNNSKIPKIEECNPNQEKEKENDMNINNQIKSKNIIIKKRNNFVENNLDRTRKGKIGSPQEKDIFKILKEQINMKKDEDRFDHIVKSKNSIDQNKNYIFNIDKNYQKNLNKEKMYNFLFNEKPTLSNYNSNNKEHLFNIQDKENNDINTIINKFNIDMKSSTATQFFRKNNTSRTNFPKYNNNRNKSYSKYYLNKLELENKLLIPQLSKRTEDLFNIKFFNINKFK